MADGKITREETFDSGIKKEIQDITSEFKNLVDELTKVTKILSEFRAETSNTTKSAAELNKIENEAKEIIDKITNAEQLLLEKKKELNVEKEKQKKADKEANDIAKLKATIDSKEAGGIEKLRAQIKLLYIERNKLKETDKDYIKNVENHNKKISEQEARLKSLSSATEKQRANIGNYSSALSGIGNVIGKVGIAFGITASATEIFNKIIGSTQTLSDGFAKAMTQAKSGVDFFFRSIATGDWKDFGKRFKEVMQAAGQYADVVDELGDLNRSFQVEQDKANIKLANLEIIYKSTNLTIQERKKALDEYLATQKELSQKSIEYAKTEYDNEVKLAAISVNLSEEKIKSLANEYEQQKPLLELGKQYNSLISERKKVEKEILDVNAGTSAAASAGQYAANLIFGNDILDKKNEKLNQVNLSIAKMGEEGKKAGEIEAKYQSTNEEMLTKVANAASKYYKAQSSFDDNTRKAQTTLASFENDRLKDKKQKEEDYLKQKEERLTFELSLIIDEQQKEEAELKRKYTKDLETAKKYGIDLTSVTDKYNSDLAGIRKKYDDKKKAEEEKSQKEIEDQAKALIDSAKEAYQRKFEIAKDSGDKIDEYEDASLGLELQNMKTLIDSMQVDDEIKRQMLDEYYKYEAQLSKESSDNKKKTREEEKEETRKQIDAATDLINNLANLYGALNDRQIQGIETKTDKQLTDLEKERKARIKSGQDETKVDEDISRRKEELEKKRAIEIAKIQRKQAIADKAAGIFSATINTAKAVTAALPNIFLSILVGLAGALEIATIAAQPLPEIPAFKKGGKVKKTGVIKYGEEGSELVTLPSGEQYLSPSIPTLTMLPQGTDIKPADLTQQILQDSIYKINLNAEKKDENQILNEINKTLKGLKQVNVNVDKWGFRISATEGASRTKYLNEKFRC